MAAARAGGAPLRMCVVCRRRFPKFELSRYVAGPGGVLEKDERKIMPGRGWYCCGDAACAEKFSRYKPRKRAAAK